MDKVLVSIVSHGQSLLVNNLLGDLGRLSADVDILITSNIAEPEPVERNIPNVRVVENTGIKGFGANHNAAFELCNHPFFCVSNPDIRINSSPFAALQDAMRDPTVGLIAPLVVNPAGMPEDNARYFPTPVGLLKKAFGLDDGRIAILEKYPFAVDWVGGMFMFFRTEAFRQVGGFDEDFFLYYEDVDICARLWKAGWKVVVHPVVSVVHEAQRSSHRDLRYARFHSASLARYLIKHMGRLPKIHA